MRYALVLGGESASFPAGDAFLDNAVDAASADALIALGGASVRDAGKTAVLVEIGACFLADEIGLEPCDDTANVLGFSRYRNGGDAPSLLVEVVRAPWTRPAAIEAARAVFGAAGLTVAVCTDQPGRIVDRLVRPKYNAALRFLDEGLATQADMDLTCRMGLGYPDGPIERVVRGGLASHHDVTRALFDVFGTPAYAPTRAAVVAARRRRGRA